MSDYIKRQDVIDIIHKEIESTKSYIEHNTQINIKFAVEELPTLDETEIIRKAFERVVEKLGDYTMWKKEMIYDLTFRERAIINHAIKILKEECGINERD